MRSFEVVDRYALPLAIWIGFPFDKVPDKRVITVRHAVIKINPAGSILAYQHFISRQGELSGRVLGYNLIAVVLKPDPHRTSGSQANNHIIPVINLSRFVIIRISHCHLSPRFPIKPDLRLIRFLINHRVPAH